MEPVMKRRPRLAVWQGRILEIGPLVTCLAFAGLFALVGQWDAVVPWLAVSLIVFVYIWRTERLWEWGWNEGRATSLNELLPLLDLDSSERQVQLREVTMATAPSFWQRQDRLAKIDHKATLKATLEEFELHMRGED